MEKTEQKQIPGKTETETLKAAKALDRKAKIMLNKWHADVASDGSIGIVPDEGFMVATIAMTPTAHEANAKLIAAAPDLLEALQDAEALLASDPLILDHEFNGHNPDTCVLCQARAAIAKATE